MQALVYSSPFPTASRANMPLFFYFSSSFSLSHVSRSDIPIYIYIIFPCFHHLIFRISPYFIFSTTQLRPLQPHFLFHVFTLGSILILFPNHHIFPPPPHQDLYLFLKILIFPYPYIH